MNHTETFPTVADRFGMSLQGLCRAVAARIAPGLAGWAMEAAMIVLIWTRIRRVEGRIQALLVRFRAGRLRVMPAWRVAGEPAARLPRQPTAKLPRRFAWLLPLVPSEAACFAGQLRVVLAEPEMQGLLAASPQARRVMAPLGRMLGIEASLLDGRMVVDEVAPLGAGLPPDLGEAEASAEISAPPDPFLPHWIREGWRAVASARPAPLPGPVRSG